MAAMKRTQRMVAYGSGGEGRLGWWQGLVRMLGLASGEVALPTGRPLGSVVADASRETCDLRCVSALLRQALQENSDIELDWLWYARQLEDPDERRFCLQHALELNPHSKAARRELARLDRYVEQAV